MFVYEIAYASEISITKDNGKLIVRAGTELFTQYIYDDPNRFKPVLYPVIGPRGIARTRQYPLEAAKDGEAEDHPHHASLWYSHGEVNGIDFWAAGKGKIQHNEILEITENSFTVSNLWKDPKGKTICEDIRTLSFYAPDINHRAIDFEITLIASADDLIFGDTKEGTMGIRMAPEFRLQGKVARGNSINSEGIVGKSVWGKRASWISYWAKFQDYDLCISIFDHPSNPRHPTWWHARDYGLVAANPFGIHHFEGKPKGEGNLVLKKEEKKNFKYRFLFHVGDPNQADVSKQYIEWSKEE